MPTCRSRAPPCESLRERRNVGGRVFLPGYRECARFCTVRAVLIGRLWMISPYVRRLRLGTELRALRAEAGLTHEQLAKLIGESRAQISRLENGHVVDQADVIKILDALGVEGDRWTQVVTIAREAGEKGWWESTRGMGERQALYANLEAGAAQIREYQQTFIPGLLQTPEFVQARADSDATLEPLTYTARGVLAGNAGRQRMLRRPGAPGYEVIIDEPAVHRLAAPPDVVKKQLYHLATATTANQAPPPGTAGEPGWTLHRAPLHVLDLHLPRPRRPRSGRDRHGDLRPDAHRPRSDHAVRAPLRPTARRRAPPGDSLDLLTKAATQLPHKSPAKRKLLVDDTPALRLAQIPPQQRQRQLCRGRSHAGRVVGVRDSKQHGRGPILEFTRAAWESFIRAAKDGKFDL